VIVTSLREIAAGKVKPVMRNPNDDDLPPMPN
jgi:hypothetical protein